MGKKNGWTPKVISTLLALSSGSYPPRLVRQADFLVASTWLNLKGATQDQNYTTLYTPKLVCLEIPTISPIIVMVKFQFKAILVKCTLVVGYVHIYFWQTHTLTHMGLVEHKVPHSIRAFSLWKWAEFLEYNPHCRTWIDECLGSFHLVPSLGDQDPPQATKNRIAWTTSPMRNPFSQIHPVDTSLWMRSTAFRSGLSSDGAGGDSELFDVFGWDLRWWTNEQCFLCNVVFLFFLG